jgi:hypothetical protein
MNEAQRRTGQVGGVARWLWLRACGIVICIIYADMEEMRERAEQWIDECVNM